MQLIPIKSWRCSFKPPTVCMQQNSRSNSIFHWLYDHVLQTLRWEEAITINKVLVKVRSATGITSSYVHCYRFLGVQYPTMISLGALWREQPTYCTKSLTLHCPRDTPILQGVHNSRCLYKWNHAVSLTTLFHCKPDFYSWLVLLLVCKHRVYY